jgi:hypothetical protein
MKVNLDSKVQKYSNIEHFYELRAKIAHKEFILGSKPNKLPYNVAQKWHKFPSKSLIKKYSKNLPIFGNQFNTFNLIHSSNKEVLWI